jgi:hypothetical protein
MRLDDASTQLLLAYCHSVRARHRENEGNGEHDREAARQYLGRGTNALWNRLQDTANASSDANIQAVLLLVAYTKDFGQQGEVDIHAEALRTMVAQRGGLAEMSGIAVLYHQLAAADSSRVLHLTLTCREECGRDLRFPEGFWGASQQAT